jgi:4'-phosphopantetheinyl transferase
MTAGPAITVDLWTWTLDVDDAERGRLYAYLSEDEAARASRFVFERDRQRFIVARGRLREVLAHVVGVKPATLRFDYAAHGKPSLAAFSDVRFNLSHSEALAALAVSRAGVEIGVDVEHVRPLKEDIAERFFSRREAATLRALPESEQVDAFFRCWTRKEAIVKAIGEGLSHALDSFDVTLTAHAPAIVERFAGESDAPHVWRLAHFDPAPGYVGAVACRTGGAAITVVRREVDGA